MSVSPQQSPPKLTERCRKHLCVNFHHQGDMLTEYTGAARPPVDLLLSLGTQPRLAVVLLGVLPCVGLNGDAIIPAGPPVALALALALSRAGPGTIEAAIYYSILLLKIPYLPLLSLFLPLSSTKPHLSSTTPKLWGWKEDSSLQVLASTKDWFIKGGLWPFCSSHPSSSTTSSVPTSPTRGRKLTASRPSTPAQLRPSTTLPGR